VIAQEWRRFLSAMRFLTRLPVPTGDWDAERPARAARYFSAVGLLVGLISAGALVAARQVWPEGVLPALLAVGVGIIVTGAFHEDGLADTADGLGGGATPEARLAIMKDSREGSYGALALGFVLALKVLALGMLQPAWTAAAVLVCAHAAARAAAVVVMAATPYAGSVAISKFKPEGRDVGVADCVIALAIGLAPLALLSPLAAAACVTAGALGALWVAFAARRLIGGHTGDVLGAVEQVFEAGFLLAAAALL
jgi:adenosylcobinamide-GDP ribazoletransferase